ncbi:hypothetical protein L226DRAFT_53469 [Lentinus tigrinus ALCF2SS1-7]|nr:hypothetical protein L226DRAFT_53469 [Lentinus tigrinus ALCF2SS1-7]
MVLTKLYSNTFLASLNNRALIAQPTTLTRSFMASGGFAMPASRSSTMLGDGASASSRTQGTCPSHEASKHVVVDREECPEMSV